MNNREKQPTSGSENSSWDNMTSPNTAEKQKKVGPFKKLLIRAGLIATGTGAIMGGVHSSSKKEAPKQPTATAESVMEETPTLAVSDVEQMASPVNLDVAPTLKKEPLAPEKNIEPATEAVVSEGSSAAEQQPVAEEQPVLEDGGNPPSYNNDTLPPDRSNNEEQPVFEDGGNPPSYNNDTLPPRTIEAKTEPYINEPPLADADVSVEPPVSVRPPATIGEPPLEKAEPYINEPPLPPAKGDSTAE